MRRSAQGMWALALLLIMPAACLQAPPGPPAVSPGGHGHAHFAVFGEALLQAASVMEPVRHRLTADNGSMSLLATAERVHDVAQQTLLAGVGNMNPSEYDSLQWALRRRVAALLVPLLDTWLQLAAEEAAATFNADIRNSSALAAEAAVYEGNYLAAACRAYDSSLLNFKAKLTAAAAAFGCSRSGPASRPPSLLTRLSWAVHDMYARRLLGLPLFSSMSAGSGWAAAVRAEFGCEAMAALAEVYTRRVESSLRAFLTAREAHSRLAGVLPRRPRLLPPIRFAIHAVVPNPRAARQELEREALQRRLDAAGAMADSKRRRRAAGGLR